MVTPTISNARSRGREDRGAADKSTPVHTEQRSGTKGKGKPPKWGTVPVPFSAGSSEKIRRTVTICGALSKSRQAVFGFAGIADHLP